MGKRSISYSLRVKITASFVVIVLGGAAVSTTIGSRIITRALLGQASRRVVHGVEAAQLAYESSLDRVKRIVGRIAGNEHLTASALARDAAALGAVLQQQRRKEAALDFVGFIDADGQAAHGAEGESGTQPRPGASLTRVAREAAAGRVAVGTEVLAAADLREESLALERRARVHVPGTTTVAVTSGLAMMAAAPVIDRNRLVGIVYGGVLLNNGNEVVDQIASLIFGRELQGDPGAVTLFAGDVRVATNLGLGSGPRQVGTRAATDVAQAVLGGRAWQGQSSVLGKPYVTAYQPIRGLDGRVLGILGVGLPERPFLAVRTEMMLTFLGVAVLGVLVVLGLTYLITRSMIHPLEAMVAGTERIAAGNLDYRVDVRGRDEIGLLAVSFNKMVDALQATKTELQDWALLLEEKVKQRTEELVAMQSSMVQSEKLASLGRLAAGVAHEINNPLGGILAFSMLALEDCKPDNPLRGNLEIISKQAMRCREIVRGLLEFSRRADVPLAPTNVSTVVGSALSLLTNQAIFMNVKVVQELAPGLPPILIDPSHLQQVIVNLVLNAVDAMEQSGELRISTRHDAQAGEVLLSIGDTGKGIAQELLPLIFEPFFTTKKVGQGTGLGLAIVHGIVTRVEGRIEVSTSPQGTTFTLHFPIAQTSPSATDAPGASSS
jgi:two-component system, NtrC family, sensor kinase